VFFSRDGASNGSPEDARAKWKLAFSDSFRHGLDRSKWGLYSGQPGGDPGGWWAPSHVVVRRGVLNLETYRDPRFGGRWVSGGLSSARALKQTYGKYEVRFRVDNGKGVAAILLLWPVRDHWPPEIDFAEDGEMTGRQSLDVGHAALRGLGQSDPARRQGGPHALAHSGRGVDARQACLHARRRAVGDGEEPPRPRERMELAMQAQAGTCGHRYAPCPDATTPARVNMQIHWVRAYPTGD
jgi:hypothetical protein